MYPLCSVDEDHTQRAWARPQQLSETRGQQRVTLSPGVEVLVHCMGENFIFFRWIAVLVTYVTKEDVENRPTLKLSIILKSNYSVFTSYVLVHM